MGGQPRIQWWLGLLDEKRTVAASSLLGQPLSNKTTDLWQHITEAEFEFFMKFKAATARRTPTIGFLKA
jgi:hypothetical protein